MALSESDQERLYTVVESYVEKLGIDEPHWQLLQKDVTQLIGRIDWAERMSKD